MRENKDIYIDQLMRIALIVAVVAWSFQLIYPLLGVLAWGFILAVVLYPFYVWLNTIIGNRSILAATMITVSVLILLLSIIVFITNDVASTISSFKTHVDTGEITFPNPPAEIQQWPLVGEQLHQAWSSASVNLREELSKYSDVFLNAARYTFTKLLHTTKDFILFIISIIFSGFLMVYATSIMSFIRKFAKRVAHERGISLLNLIKGTIQNVSRGVIGIALLQTFILSIILLIAGVPGVSLLSLLGLILSITQVGLFIVTIPVIIWLFVAKNFAIALITSILLVLVSLLDNILKPIILARGLSTPTIIIFIGVIGGILVYGLIGVFIGPVVLAIGYDLMHQWVDTD